MTTDDELDPALREPLRGYHTPPAPPREELWARIGEARRQPPQGLPFGRPPRRLLPFLIPLAVAALVLLAFGLGRLSVGPAPESMARGSAADPHLAQRLVADDYLGQAELFLTDFRAQARSGRADSTAPVRARRLLTATRLLLDSPGGQDPRLRPLLEDLELILAQITQLPAESSRTLDLITAGLDHRGTIARLRSSVPSGPTPGMQGEI
jgi:hypothetical protein